MSDEYRLLIAGAVWVEFFKKSKQLGGDVGKLNLGIDFNLRRELVGLYMLGHILLEASAELRYVFLPERQAHGVSMAAEVLKQIPAGVDGGIDVKALY